MVRTRSTTFVFLGTAVAVSAEFTLLIICTVSPFSIRIAKIRLKHTQRCAQLEGIERRLDDSLWVQSVQPLDEPASLARDFDRMAERIQSLLASQSRLLRDISHELGERSMLI